VFNLRFCGLHNGLNSGLRTMTSKDEANQKVFDLIQGTYFDNIDSGHADKAVRAMHQDVQWVHTQVWEHHGHSSETMDMLHGRDKLRVFLVQRIPQMQIEKITHQVGKVITDGISAAFQAQVIGPKGDSKPFFGWIELKDGLIASYRVMPI
jgi:RNA-splicing ligase RtcB